MNLDKKVLNKLYVVGSILILFSSVLVMEKIKYSAFLFAIGVLLYAFVRMSNLYNGQDMNLKRLNRYYFLNVIFLILSSYLQFKGSTTWVIFLLIVALIEFYLSFREAVYEKNKNK